MILSKEEILTKIKDLAGEDMSDELIEFIENVDESIDVTDGRYRCCGGCGEKRSRKSVACKIY